MFCAAIDSGLSATALGEFFHRLFVLIVQAEGAPEIEMRFALVRTQFNELSEDVLRFVGAALVDQRLAEVDIGIREIVLELGGALENR